VSEENGGLTVGVDLGGTKIAAGTVDPGGAIVSRVRVPTSDDPDRITEAIVEADWNLSSTYAIYAGFAVLSFIFVAARVRETNGKKLEEMR
jgi:predicted NBD/HSP70 family sugar kinase